MKIRLALLLVVVAAAAVAFAMLRHPASRPRAAPSTPSARPSARPSASAQEVVTAYLESLQKKDFRAAYAQLSKASQQAHSYQDFVSRCEKSGVPTYDLAQAHEKPGDSGRATITVPLVEDPAEAEFTAVVENGTWKIVFIGGAPAFPYPE